MRNTEKTIVIKSGVNDLLSKNQHVKNTIHSYMKEVLRFKKRRKEFFKVKKPFLRKKKS